MRRRRTAAPGQEENLSPSLDFPESRVIDAESEETTSESDTLSPVADGDIAASVGATDETAPARPRRTRRTKAQLAAIAEAAAAEQDTPVEGSTEIVFDAPVVEAETAPSRPRRPRSPRKPAPVAEIAISELPEHRTVADIAVHKSAADFAEQAQPLAHSDSPQPRDSFDAPESAEELNVKSHTEDTDSLFLPAEDPFADAEEAIFADNIPATEDTDTLEASDSDPATATARSKRNRRGRGRDRSRSDAATEPVNEPAPRRQTSGGTRRPAGEPAATAQAGTGIIRKRGPQTLAKTLSLPTLPPTLLIPDSSEIGTASTSSAPIVTGRRGFRTVPALRRILTPQGIAIVPAEVAAALLSSTVALAGAPPSLGETGRIPAPLLPLLAPTALSPAYQPLPAETLARLPEVGVARANGLLELRVNGNPVFPAFLFVNTEVIDEPETAQEIAVSQIRRAYAAGVRLFTLLAHLPWKRRSGDRRHDSIDRIMTLVAENAPDALVLPRLIFSPPASWERANPEEISVYANGETGDVSLASNLFWQDEAKSAFRAAIEHLAESDFAARVLGVYLEHGEWLQPKGVGPDRSVANTSGFRAWLQERYKNSEVALRASWYDGSVTFETAEIPSDEAFAAAADPTNTQAVFLSDRETRCADFFAYTSDLTAERITSLAAVAKEASGGRLAVAVSYGYTLELARPGCGHYALAEVLASPDIDILTAPISYSGRTPGGSAPVALPVDSVLLAGKLFVFEDDTKTHKALRETEDLYNPKIATPDGTRSVHARNLGAALARGCGISWMDLWGEGWLDDDAIWSDLASLIGLAANITERRRLSEVPFAGPDVAVFVDEKSLFPVRGGEEPPLLHQLIGRHRDTLLRAGARVGFYLLSDLLNPEFPKSPRLMVFLNAFRIPTEIRAAIQGRFQDDGRTLAWIFAPGARESANIAELADVIGMQLRLQPWGSRMGTQITEGRSPLTESARGQRFGEEKRTNPSFMVVDPKAQLLGEYVQSGNASLAVRKHARWQSVFVGERDLPLPLLRGLYKLSGIPIATAEDEATHVASDGFLVLHTAMGGAVTVYSVDRTRIAVCDALTGEILAGVGYGARLSVPARETRLLILATPAELTGRFGVAEEAFAEAPAGLTEAEAPSAAVPFVFENTAPVLVAGQQSMRLQPVELSVSPEEIALFEAALSGELELTDQDKSDGGIADALAADDSAAAGRKKRRRRRRRGGAGADLLGESIGDEDEEEDGQESFVLGLSGDARQSEYESDAESSFTRAEAALALAELAQSATSHETRSDFAIRETRSDFARINADVLLPLIRDEEPELNARSHSDGNGFTGELLAESPDGDDEQDIAWESGSSDVVSEPVSADRPLTDPVAELMARIFAVPALVEERDDSESAPMVASADRPIDTNSDPWIGGDSGRFVSDPSEPIDGIPSQAEPRPARSTEPEDIDGLTETPLGLLSAVGRRRRGGSTAGGFASRLRRRRSEETAEGSEEPASPPETLEGEYNA